MTTRRRVLLYIMGGFALLLVLLALLPLLFRGQIEARIQQAINDRVNARIAWRGLGVTLFRDFPNLTLRLDQLTIAGVGPFQRDTLLRVPGFRAALDLGSVLRSVRGSGPIVIRAVELDRPAARLIVLKDGTANWDIMKPSPGPAAPSRALNISYRALLYKIKDVGLPSARGRADAASREDA